MSHRLKIAVDNTISWAGAFFFATVFALIGLFIVAIIVAIAGGIPVVAIVTTGGSSAGILIAVLSGLLGVFILRTAWQAWRLLSSDSGGW